MDLELVVNDDEVARPERIHLAGPQSVRRPLLRDLAVLDKKEAVVLRQEGETVLYVVRRFALKTGYRGNVNESDAADLSVLIFLHLRQRAHISGHIGCVTARGDRVFHCDLLPQRLKKIGRHQVTRREGHRIGLELLRKQRIARFDELLHVRRVVHVQPHELLLILVARIGIEDDQPKVRYLLRPHREFPLEWQRGRVHRRHGIAAE